MCNSGEMRVPVLVISDWREREILTEKICHSVFKKSLIIASVIVIINIKMFGLGCLLV